MPDLSQFREISTAIDLKKTILQTQEYLNPEFRRKFKGGIYGGDGDKDGIINEGLESNNLITEDNISFYTKRNVNKNHLLENLFATIKSKDKKENKFKNDNLDIKSQGNLNYLMKHFWSDLMKLFANSDFIILIIIGCVIFIIIWISLLLFI